MEVGVERRVGDLLDAELLQGGDARGVGDAAGDGADLLLGDAGPGAELGDRDLLQVGEGLLGAGGVLGQEAMVDEVFL